MRQILESATRSGCMTVPVLANIAPSPLRRKLATGNMLHSINDHPNWPLYAEAFDRPVSYGLHLDVRYGEIIRYDTCPHNYTVDRIHVLGFYTIVTVIGPTTTATHDLCYIASGQVKPTCQISCR